MTVNKDAALLKQIEYYLGDFNLVHDKFFKAEISKNDGWIPITTFLNCKRVVQITTEVSDIVHAIREGDPRPEAERLLEVNEVGDSLRRKPSHPVSTLGINELLEQHGERHVYCKGLPRKITLTDIQEFLEKAGPTVYVNMRYYTAGESKAFKGSINAVYATIESAEKFLKDEEFSKFNNQPLQRMKGSDFLAEKEAERSQAKQQKMERQKKVEKNLESQAQSHMVQGALLELSVESDGNVQKRLFDNVPDDKNGEAKKNEENGTEPEGEQENGTKNSAGQKRHASSALGDTENGDERARAKLFVSKIKTSVTDSTNGKYVPAWVDIDITADKALVRFKEPNAASEVLKSLSENGPFRLFPSGPSVTGRVLSGDEELEQWKKIVQIRETQSKKRNFRGPPNKRGRR